MRELERFQAIDSNGLPCTVIIRQYVTQVGDGPLVPGLIYANLSTGERLEHRYDTDTFITGDGGHIVRTVRRLVPALALV